MTLTKPLDLSTHRVGEEAPVPFEEPGGDVLLVLVHELEEVGGDCSTGP